MGRMVRGFVFALVAAQIAIPTFASHKGIADGVGTGPLALHAIHQVADGVGTGPLAHTVVRPIA